MGKQKVYYINDNLEIKLGYTSANIDINKISEVVIDYKNQKFKINSELISKNKEKLIKKIENQKIIKLAESYDLKAEWKGIYLELKSKFDLWYVYENTSNKLVWVHKNKKGSKHDNHEHIQKVMYSNTEEDYIYIFRTIKQHDEYRMLKFSQNRMMHLFDMIKCNQVPKFKIS